MKIKQIISIAFFLFGFSIVYGKVSLPNKDVHHKSSNVDKQYFIENKGQWPSEVLYLTQTSGLNTWITTKGMLYEFYKSEVKTTSLSNQVKDENSKYENSPNVKSNNSEQDYKLSGQRIAYTFSNNNLLVKTQSLQKQEGCYNYLIGNDRSKHTCNVGLYKKVVIKEIYNGIDIRYYFDKGTLRYDYIIHPGADPTQISFNIEGSENTYLNSKGELVFVTCFGEVKNADLYCYQNDDKKQVAAKFIKKTESWTIALGDYNTNQILIIDPLIYSTYLGGNNNETVTSITVDASGNSYTTGETTSINYHTTLGVFQTTLIGNDIFVSKLNAMGTALIYSTFIGGSGAEIGESITLDNLGNAYITGKTTSSDYNVTAGAFQSIYEGNNDVFVTKLNATGTALLYSTLIGGSDGEEGRSITIDASGNAYIAGYSGSTNYDITPSSFQITFGGGYRDAFVTKLNATGTALLFSTYIGGSKDDEIRSIAIDAIGNSYVTGYTTSTDYDITPGSFQTMSPGGPDNKAFITKLNASGNALVYSTYIGGSAHDQGNSIAIDASGNAYITGETTSTNYDVTSGAFQMSLQGSVDVFVSKLNPLGNALIYSTYIGGNDGDGGTGIAIDGIGNAYITGWTYSSNYDCTIDAYQSTFGGNYDAFVTKLNATGTALLYSTLIGGSNYDEAKSIALDSFDNIYITGQTYSTDFDITVGSFQSNNAGLWDSFISKFGILIPESIIEIRKTDFFSVFPNPSEDGIYHIKCNDANLKFLSAEVYDLQGRLINNTMYTIDRNIELNLSNEPSGVYIIKARTIDFQETMRLIKL